MARKVSSANAAARSCRSTCDRLPVIWPICELIAHSSAASARRSKLVLPGAGQVPSVGMPFGASSVITACTDGVAPPTVRQPVIHSGTGTGALASTGAGGHTGAAFSARGEAAAKAAKRCARTTLRCAMWRRCWASVLAGALPEPPPGASVHGGVEAEPMVKETSSRIENEKWIVMNTILTLASTSTLTESSMKIGWNASITSVAVAVATSDSVALMMTKSTEP